MKIEVELDELTVLRLRSLVGPMPQPESVEDVIVCLCNTVAEGLRRYGAWECEVVDKVFPEGVGDNWIDWQRIGVATAWYRNPALANEEFPAGWIPRVVNGDKRILFDGVPCDRPSTAMEVARAWLLDSELEPVEDVLIRLELGVSDE